MKSIIASGLLLGMAHGTAAVAGPYANVETNAAFFGSDYQAAVTEVHGGYEWKLGEEGTVYLQGGPAFVAVEGHSTDTEVSAKLGISGAVTEQLELYGELSALTTDLDITDELALGIKAGATFRF